MPRTPTRRATAPTAALTACSSTRTAPCVLATSASQKAASAQRQARLAGGGADDAVVPTFCYKIEAVLGMRFCDPDQLIGKKRRNRLAAARALRIRQPVVLVAWLDRGFVVVHDRFGLSFRVRCEENNDQN